MKKILLFLTIFGISSIGYAGQNKFTYDTYETPSGAKTKVLIQENNRGESFIIACNNKIIGEQGISGKMMIMVQDHDVVTKVKKLPKNRLEVETKHGWKAIFKGKSVPKC